MSVDGIDELRHGKREEGKGKESVVRKHQV